LRGYLDTSVVLALALDEPASPKQDLWLRENATERFIGSFAWGEFVDTIARYVRRHAITPAAGLVVLDTVDQRSGGLQRCETLDADIVESAEFITADMTRGLKLGDAIHLATCRRLGATLIKGDRRQAAAATAFDIPSHLIFPDPEP
jgi:predicted nucleic acid-binding protein